MLFLFFVMSCETFLYDDYKIIDYKRKVDNRYIHKDNLYKVKKGDNLFSISRRFNISIQELIKVNKIQEPYKIFPNPTDIDRAINTIKHSRKPLIISGRGALNAGQQILKFINKYKRCI